MLAEGAPPRDIADALAEIKARRVAGRPPERAGARRRPGARPRGRGLRQARRPARRGAQLRRLRGRTHELLSAAVVFEDGAARSGATSAEARLTMRRVQRRLARRLPRPQLGDALSRHASAATGSRRRRRPLFDRVEGDYSSPSWACRSLELLSFLRTRRGRSPDDRAPPLAGVVGWPVAPFALAAAARPLARGAMASPATTCRSRSRPSDLRQVLRRLPRLGFLGVQRHHPAQGGGAGAGRPRHRRGRR